MPTNSAVFQTKAGAAHGNVKDISGQRFRRLTVIDRAPSTAGRIARWNCACDCGGKAVVAGAALRCGKTQSCGCLKSEATARRNASAAKHGHSSKRTPTYHSWLAMIRRCTSETAANWEDYGGRGIAVCDRWRVFENFLADMGERPAGTTLDRIENDGDYELGNCEWRTPKAQAGNRRNSPEIVIGGCRRRLADISAETGIPHRVAYRRIFEKGWSPERAVGTPYPARIASV